MKTVVCRPESVGGLVTKVLRSSLQPTAELVKDKNTTQTSQTGVVFA